jgi:hypothetical protein
MGVWLFTRGIVVTFNKIQNRMAINLIIFFLVFKNFYTEFAEFADYKNRNYQFATCNCKVASFIPIQFKVQFDLDVTSWQWGIWLWHSKFPSSS